MEERIMADPRRSLGDPVAFVLPRSAARWPLWAMMGLGLYLSSVPLSWGWTSETAVSCGLLGGLAAFGLALFSRLHEPLSHLAYLNAFIGAGALALELLGGQAGPLWIGPALIGCALAARASTSFHAVDAPPGGFHNPSAWIQRLPLAAMTVLGALGSRGDRPAAALFLAALAAALLGDRKRWRTAPWAVFAGSAVLACAAAAAAARLAAQPSAAATAAALASAVFAILSVDEWRATRFFLRQAPQLGQTLRSAFWSGGLLPEDAFAPRPSRQPAWSPPRSLGRRHGRRGKPRGLISRLRRAT
jgi:hypothetical protein